MLDGCQEGGLEGVRGVLIAVIVREGTEVFIE